MKPFVLRVSIIWLLLVSAALLHAAPRTRTAGPPTRMLVGRVRHVDGQSVTISLYVLGASAEAAGKIPDEMAQQAAVLSGQAARLEKEGKTAQAERIRKHVEELLRWREIDQTVPLDGTTPISGITRAGIADVTPGMRLRAVISVTNAPADGAVALHGVLTRDVTQLGQRAIPAIQRLPAVARTNSTYYVVIGDVIQSNPLVVTSGDTTVQIDTPAQYGCIKQVPVSANELADGQRVLVRAVMHGDLTIGALIRLMIVFHPDVTLDQTYLFE